MDVMTHECGVFIWRFFIEVFIVKQFLLIFIKVFPLFIVWLLPLWYPIKIVFINPILRLYLFRSTLSSIWLLLWMTIVLHFFLNWSITMVTILFVEKHLTVHKDS
jgi:hypothetical protein